MVPANEGTTNPEPGQGISSFIPFDFKQAHSVFSSDNVGTIDYEDVIEKRICRKRELLSA